MSALRMDEALAAQAEPLKPGHGDLVGYLGSLFVPFGRIIEPTITPGGELVADGDGQLPDDVELGQFGC